jgi:hypothetical protein
MSFLVKYGRYSVAQFFRSSEARRAINAILPSGGTSGGSVDQVYGNSPIYISGSIAQPVVNIAPSAIITSGAQTFNGVKTFSSTPTTPTPAIGFQDGNQIVNKNYVDTVAAGLRVVASVVAATPPSFGTGLGLYAGDDLDDVTLVDQDRVLLKDEPNPEDNGIYVIHTSPTAPTRATDYNSTAEVKSGTFTTVLGGTVNANTQWAQYTEDPIIDVDPLKFSNLGIASSVISVNGQTGTVALTATDIGLGNVDNTSDIDKPISTLVQTALDNKLEIKDINDAGTGALTSLISPATDLPADYVLVSDASGKVWYSTIKANELDTLAGANTATTIQTQLNAKAPIASPSFTGNPTAVTQAISDNSTKLATTEYVDRVSIAPVIRQITSDTAEYTSNTFSTVLEFSQVTLAANSTYYFKFKCHITTNVGTTAAVLAIAFTSGSATSINYLRAYPTSSAAGAYIYETITAVDSGTISLNGPGSISREHIMEGTIVTGASSIALVLRARTEVNATTWVKVMSGSFGIIQKIL